MLTTIPLIVGCLVIANLWFFRELRVEIQKRRFLTQRMSVMDATIATVSASLTQAQKTLAAIVAANPTAPDLSSIQAQADDLATQTATLASGLGVAVPTPPPAAAPPAAPLVSQ